MNIKTRDLLLLTVTILALASVLAWAPGVARPAHSTPSALEPFLPRVAAASADHATPAGASSRLLLVENAGQWSDGARFQAWGGPGTMWLAENAIWITMVQQPVSSSAHHGVNLKLSFVDANPHPLIESLGRQATKVSYVFGSDPDQWHAEVPVWSEVRYDELYPGVDLVLGADASATLPWSFEIQPGAESSAVRLRVEGADSVALDGRLLRITTAVGELALPLPAADSFFRVEATTTGGSLLSFDAAPGGVVGQQAFDIAREAPADNPAELLVSTFLGGSSTDAGNAIALDSSGRVYVTGETGSSNFPTTPGAFGGTFGGGTCGVTPYTYPCGDAFVVRLNAAGSALDYATFLGGSNSDLGQDLAVDSSGRAIVTGRTSSGNFPTTAGAYDRTFGGGTCGVTPNTYPCDDAFVVRLNAAGSVLDYATFLGGGNIDAGSAIALDRSGRVTVTGETMSGNFPTTSNAYDRTFGGGTCGWSPDTFPCYDAFVVRLNAAASALDYATFLGGSNWDIGYGLALDSSGRATVTGETRSNNFPTTPSAFDRTFGGGSCGLAPNTFPCNDAFVVRLNVAGSSLDYATFLGGSNIDSGAAIVLDDSGRTTVTGITRSNNFPTTSGAFDRSFNGDLDTYVARLNAAGSALDYATFLGGYASDRASALALDGNGHVTVTGSTQSSDFPTTTGAFDRSHNGGYDSYVARLNPTGSSLDYATFLGGTSSDTGGDLAMDTSGRAVVTGITFSSDFPTTPGAFDPSYNGGPFDAFVAKLAMGVTPPLTQTPTPTATATPTQTPTSTPLPTSTPVGPWAAWHSQEVPLLVPPNGVDAVVDYGNLMPPILLDARVSGAALFDTGAIGGTTWISTTLWTVNGSYALPLIPAISATQGDTLTLDVAIGPVVLTQEGRISRPIYLPFLLR